jgi:hypothetical protein
MINILLSGICASRGPESWPYFLSEYLDCNLVNLSLAGAGNPYIHDNTIHELGHRKYDMVVVLWGDSRHFSIKVNDITKFSDSEHTSFYQAQQNDWPGKVIVPVNDQDYVDKNWILNAGYLHNKNDSTSRFFREYYKTVSHAQVIEGDILRLIALQGVLKTLIQPYLFLYRKPYTQFKRFDHLYKMIDWDNFYTGDSLVEIADRTNDHEIDNTYPGPVGQQYYAKLIAEQIQRRLVKS